MLSILLWKVNCMSNDYVVLNAIIVAVDERKLTLQLNEKNADCSACSQRGGCQSLSAYRWLFKDSALTLLPRQYVSGEDNYCVGDNLQLRLPRKMLRHGLFGMFGLPFLGFIAGVLCVNALGEVLSFCVGIGLAAAGGYICKQWWLPCMLQHHFKMYHGHTANWQGGLFLQRII